MGPADAQQARRGARLARRRRHHRTHGGGPDEVKSGVPVFIAAGSNVEAPRNLSLALDQLEREFGPITLSNAYRNKAIGFDGPDFINLVAGFRTTLGVREVMERLHRIEAHCGR